MALPKMSQEDRKKIKDACSGLGTKNAATTREMDEDENFVFFYNLLAASMQQAVGNTFPKTTSRLSPNLKKIIRDGWEEVEAFLLQIKSKPNQKIRLTFYQFAIDAAISYVSELDKVPTTMKNVSRQLSNCAAMIDLQFPGYARSGLLRLILDWGRPGSTIDKVAL